LNPDLPVALSLASAFATAVRPQILLGYRPTEVRGKNASRALMITIGGLGVIVFAHVRAG